MSTRSLIAVKKEDKSYDAIYCHFDGYPEGVGAMLLENYNTKELVEKLISNGDMSSIGETTEKCVFYHRDRGEELNIRSYKTKTELKKAYKDSWCEYLYIFNKGVWYCDGAKLEEVLEGIKY